MGNDKTRFEVELKKRVVREIVEGHLLIHEAMEKYYIKSRLTIINWLKSKDKYYSNI